ncbi:unnamed protein product [Paramecium primaurelia]|nr:unnamed protein product [Paramecium primaurelia]
MKQITDVLKNQKIMTSITKTFPPKKMKNQHQVQLKASRITKGSLNFNETMIQCGSNSLHILVQMKEDLRNQKFQKIKIQNVSLEGANFARCNFSESQFNNVNISGINLDGALLLNCSWKDLKILELNKLDGHQDQVNSVCFSPDGNIQASGSGDKSIRLWDVKTGQQKAKLDGYNDYVRSVCISPDGNTLACGSDDKSILLWDVKTGQQKAQLDGHISCVFSVCFSPDGNILAFGSRDNSIHLWNVKHGKENLPADKNNKDFLVSFKAPLFQGNLCQNPPILLFCEYLKNYYFKHKEL